jgi:hypothetical protein
VGDFMSFMQVGLTQEAQPGERVPDFAALHPGYACLSLSCERRATAGSAFNGLVRHRN